MSRDTQEKRGGGPLKEQKIREGDWICAECDAHNYNARMTCFKCTLPKEASELKLKGKSALDWECFECKASNFSWREECFKCHITRFASDELKARQVGLDWFCRFCDLKNFPNRFECFKCKRHRDVCDSRGPPGPPPGMNRGPSPRRSPPRMGMRRSSPSRRPMSPNRRPMSPNRRQMSPPGRGRSPLRRQMSPSGRGRSPPRRQMSPPRRGRSPPFRGRDSGPQRSPPYKRGASPSRGCDEWKCGLCSAMNGMRRDHCYKCATPQGGPDTRGSGRQGPSSSQPGPSLLGQVFGADEKRSGDWDCPECHVNNFHFRKQCFKCKSEKPEEASQALNNATQAGILNTPEYKPDDYYEPESPPKRRRMNNDSGTAPKVDDVRQQYGPDWVCKFCKVDIFPTRNDCYKCGRSRDECEVVILPVGGGHSMSQGGSGGPGGHMMAGPHPGPPVQQGYACECGNFNRCDEPCCLQCGKPNNLLSGPPPSEPNLPPMERCQPLPNVDWDCRECKINNFHHRTNCFKCKKPREECEDRSSWVGGIGERQMSPRRDARRGKSSSNYRGNLLRKKGVFMQLAI